MAKPCAPSGSEARGSMGPSNTAVMVSTPNASTTS